MSEPRFGPSVNFDKSYEVYMARHDSMNGDDYGPDDSEPKMAVSGREDHVSLTTKEERDSAVFALANDRLPRALFRVLHSFHAGTDRGELMAFLCEAWGPSPARAKLCGDGRQCVLCGSPITEDDVMVFAGGVASHSGRCPSPAIAQPSDIRGLAARKSQR